MSLKDVIKKAVAEKNINATKLVKDFLANRATPKASEEFANAALRKGVKMSDAVRKELETVAGVQKAEKTPEKPEKKNTGVRGER